MGEEVVAVTIIAIGCGTGVAITFIHAVKSLIEKRMSGSLGQDVAGEIRALREEVKSLRQQNVDVILALDQVSSRELRPRELDRTAGSRVERIADAIEARRS